MDSAVPDNRCRHRVVPSGTGSLLQAERSPRPYPRECETPPVDGDSIFGLSNNAIGNQIGAHVDVLNAQQRMEYLDRLIQLTADGEIDWRQSSESETSFYALLSNSSVWIGSVDDDGRHPYRFTIDQRNDDNLFDEANELVVVRSGTTLGQLPLQTNKLLEQLFAAVRSYL